MFMSVRLLIFPTPNVTGRCIENVYRFGFNSFHRPRLSDYTLNLEGELEQSLLERYPDLLYIRGYFAMV